MPVARYHFHCVGSEGDAVFDRAGRWVARTHAVGPTAEAVAQALMAGGPDLDWSGWWVDVHDARGRRVLMRKFSDARGERAMGMKTSYLVQPFELHRKKLRPTRQETAATESGALKKAENLAKRMPGAAALRIVADDETGEMESATILGQLGRGAGRLRGRAHRWLNARSPPPSWRSPPP